MIEVQSVEINAFDAPLHCPFCGAKVINIDAEAPEGALNPCPHTLFIATDAGFDYRSPRIEKQLALLNIDDVEYELPDGGYTELAGQLGIHDTIVVESFAPAPFGFASYIALAPAEKTKA